MRIEIDDVIFILQNIAIVLISAILFKYARYILKFLTPLTPPSSPTVTNEVQEGFNEEDLEGFDGGARRTKKRRSRRSNKTKLVRRPQNRVYQRRTSKKRSKN
jgi:hypothetical protein